MAWLVRFDFQDGNGWIDLTDYIDFKSLKKSENLHNDLKSNRDTAELIMRSNSYINNFLTTTKKVNRKINY